MKRLTTADINRLAWQAVNDKSSVPLWLFNLEWSTEHYYTFLYLVAREMQPELTLELGTGRGTSSCFLAFGAEPRRVVTVDGYKELVDHIIAVKAGNDIDNLDPIFSDSCGPTVLAAIQTTLHIGGIDLLYVDSDHNYAHAKKEYDLYRPLMSSGGVMIWDDINMNDMGRFWGELKEEKTELNFLHYSGFGAAIVS